MRWTKLGAVSLAALAVGGIDCARPALAADANVPVLVPLTGFLSVEGTSQRNGAVLALGSPPAGVKATFDVSDTGVSPEVAVNALERAVSQGPVTAVVASMLGAQVLALLPVALEHKVPLITISGTAAVTQQGNPYIFRFFPGDQVVKEAQVLFAIKQYKIKHPAVIYQTTAYGQSGHGAIDESLKKHGIEPVYEEALDVSIKDMTPTLSKAKAAGADSLLLQLHGGPTALFLKAAASANLGLPIVAGSGVSQPSTVALLDPLELKGVCGETGSSPVSAETPEMTRFLAQYRKAYSADPDSFAVQQYDGTMMVLDAVAHGAKDAAAVTAALSTNSYKGVAMTYKSDGHGDMAHSAVIICYDGQSRIPKVAMHYTEDQAAK
ncbi:MAG TPA: ABC transporter substrate-binding protein [Stellaceae bacterium]|jgi:branched-chain amino acid transport system substrate-binding protein|nr:ABC transporter substrate-binding protein [Stellaceae bacterium]